MLAVTIVVTIVAGFGIERSRRNGRVVGFPAWVAPVAAASAAMTIVVVVVVVVVDDVVVDVDVAMSRIVVPHEFHERGAASAAMAMAVVVVVVDVAVAMAMAMAVVE